MPRKLVRRNAGAFGGFPWAGLMLYGLLVLIAFLGLAAAAGYVVGWVMGL